MAAFLLSFTVLAALGAERLLVPHGTLVIALVIAATAFDLTRTGPIPDEYQPRSQCVLPADRRLPADTRPHADAHPGNIAGAD
jgi:hypothetical protein